MMGTDRQSPQGTPPSSQDTSTRWEHTGDGILRASWDVPRGTLSAEVEFLSPEGPLKLTMTHQVFGVIHEQECVDLLKAMEAGDAMAAIVSKMENDPGFQAEIEEAERRQAARREAEAAFDADLEEIDREHAARRATETTFDAEIDALAAEESRRDADVSATLERAAARPAWSPSEEVAKAFEQVLNALAGAPVIGNDEVGLFMAMVGLGQRIADDALTDEDRRLAAEFVAVVRPEMEAAGLFDPMPGADETFVPYPRTSVGKETVSWGVDRERVVKAWAGRLETCVALAEARLRRLKVEHDVARAVAASLNDGPGATSLRGVLEKAQAIMDADPRVVMARADYDAAVAEFMASKGM